MMRSHYIHLNFYLNRFLIDEPNSSYQCNIENQIFDEKIAKNNCDPPDCFLFNKSNSKCNNKICLRLRKTTFKLVHHRYFEFFIVIIIVLSSVSIVNQFLYLFTLTSEYHKKFFRL